MYKIMYTHYFTCNKSLYTLLFILSVSSILPLLCIIGLKNSLSFYQTTQVTLSVDIATTAGTSSNIYDDYFLIFDTN